MPSACCCYWKTSISTKFSFGVSGYTFFVCFVDRFLDATDSNKGVELCTSNKKKTHAGKSGFNLKKMNLYIVARPSQNVQKSIQAGTTLSNHIHSHSRRFRNKIEKETLCFQFFFSDETRFSETCLCAVPSIPRKLQGLKFSDAASTQTWCMLHVSVIGETVFKTKTLKTNFGALKNLQQVEFFLFFLFKTCFPIFSLCLWFCVVNHLLKTTLPSSTGEEFSSYHRKLNCSLERIVAATVTNFQR